MEWKVYYLRQIHPEWGIKELAEFLNLGRSTVQRALSRLKLAPRNLQFFPRDNMRKIFHILEEEPSSENLFTFVRGINYCPLLPHPEESGTLMELLPAVENLLLPEVVIYLYSLILNYPERFEEYLNASTFERLMVLRDGFITKGLMYSYYLATIPLLVASVHFSYPLNPDEYEYVMNNLHRFPPFYRDLLSRYNDLLKMAFRGTGIQFPETVPASPFLKFSLALLKGQYEKALQMDVNMDELTEEERQWYRILRTNLSMFLSPTPPPPPHYDFRPTSAFISFQILHSKLLYARLMGMDPLEVLEPEPMFHLHRKSMEKTFLNPDPHFIEREGEYPGKEMLLLLAQGKTDEAWKAARKIGSIYDFHTHYIAMGYPLIDLMIKYNLRIRWLKPEIEIYPERLIIKYAGHVRTMRGSIADILRDIVNGNGYLGNGELKKLYRLRFLNFKKKRYNGGKTFVKLEDDAIIISHKTASGL